MHPFEERDPRPLLKRILSYIDRNPLCNLTDIRRSFELPKNYASGFLSAMEAMGIVSVKIRGNRKFYTVTQKGVAILEASR